VICVTRLSASYVQPWSRRAKKPKLRQQRRVERQTVKARQPAQQPDKLLGADGAFASDLIPFEGRLQHRLSSPLQKV